MKGSFRHRLVRPVSLTLPSFCDLWTFASDPGKLLFLTRFTIFLVVAGLVQRGRSLINQAFCRTYKRNVVLLALSSRTT